MAGKKQVLVVGGYGKVGSCVSGILSDYKELYPYIAGRNVNKAEALSEKLRCGFCKVDIEDKDSVEAALENMDIVISCYTNPGNISTILPEEAIKQGVHYMDLSGHSKYNNKIIALDSEARKNNVTLITGLGLYPGLIGLLLSDNRNYFEKIGSTEIFFVSGGNWEGVSELSLCEIGHMMEETPLIYNGRKWVAADSKGKNEYIGEPFNKKIFLYPGMITNDVLKIPENMSYNKIAMWSGSETFLQGMVLYFGVKRGYTEILEKLGRFLKVLRFLGRNKNKHSLVKIVTTGSCDNIKHERVVEFNAPEQILTALAPVLVCEQIARGDIDQPGAFTPPDVVDVKILFDSFKEKDINYRESIKKFQILPGLKPGESLSSE